VCEAALSAGLNVFTGDGLATSDLLSTHNAQKIGGPNPLYPNDESRITVNWNYVTQGDFIVRAHDNEYHVIYARGDAVMEGDEVSSVPVIEADPNVRTEQGRERRGRVRDNTIWNRVKLNGYTPRRWKRW
jgi:hypothetical protein